MFRVLRKYWKELVIEWRHLQKKIFGSNSTANGSVCVISVKCNKTSCFV